MNVTTHSFEDYIPSQTLNKTKSGFWDFALHIDINTIVYLHCHQQSATVVLVAQDGVQHPPIKFPKGSHLLQFLTCLESGLMPSGQLDPPLWTDSGKGKIFPKLRRRSMKKTQQGDASSVGSYADDTKENELSTTLDDQEDFVFRIINSKSNGKRFVFCFFLFDKFFLFPFNFKYMNYKIVCKVLNVFKKLNKKQNKEQLIYAKLLDFYI